MGDYMILLENKFTDIVTESDEKGKNLYLKGIFLEAEQRNRNGRIYKRDEILKAVDKVNEAARENRHILGHLDHPNGSLDIKLDEVSHKLIEMHMEGNNAIGKAMIIPSVPKGQIAKGLIEAGIQLGVSSRGSGSVSESTGIVEGFEMVTIDIVANPSAINAYPLSIQESMALYGREKVINDLAEAVIHDDAAQKYFEKEILKFIRECFTK